MKKLLLFSSVFFCLFISLQAQEQTKRKEAGIVFYSLDNFGVVYRVGSDRALWRMQTLFLVGSSRNHVADSSEVHQGNNGVSVRFGREFRKEISEKLFLRYGADAFFSFQNNTYEFDDKSIDNYDQHTKTRIYAPGVAFVIGVNYELNDHLVCGFELLPSVSYQGGKGSQRSGNIENEYDISGFDYGISSGSALLSIVYKF